MRRRRYAVFHAAEQTGGPVYAPLWVEFPAETQAFGMDAEHMVGGALLVRPVTERGATNVSVYLPGGNDQVLHRTLPHLKNFFFIMH